MADVLLIEPDKILARNYQKTLSSAGHTVVWRSNGQAAIHALDDRCPDVILLELQMALHNGLEFLHELRSYPEWQNIPVILLTMVPDMSVHSGSFMQDLGVVGYLYKPQSKLRHVLSSVERALKSVPT